VIVAPAVDASSATRLPELSGTTLAGVSAVTPGAWAIAPASPGEAGTCESSRTSAPTAYAA
jgi:hypothetical protein